MEIALVVGDKLVIDGGMAKFKVTLENGTEVEVPDLSRFPPYPLVFFKVRMRMGRRLTLNRSLYCNNRPQQRFQPR